MARRSWLPSLWSEERPGGDPFHQLRQEVDRLFDDFMAPALRPRSTGQAQMTISPEIDVAETDRSIEITADMPGIDEKDIEITSVTMSSRSRVRRRPRRKRSRRTIILWSAGMAHSTGRFGSQSAPTRTR